MAAVSNSSPLILLAYIDRFDLLRLLFDEIYIPPAVWQEVVVDGADRPGSREVVDAPWIHLRPAPAVAVPAWLLGLDAGETEAIMLAAALDPRIAVLLDDQEARRTAHAVGMTVIRSAGILVRAKNRGIIRSIRPLLGELRSAGLYLSNAAVHELLDFAGES